MKEGESDAGGKVVEYLKKASKGELDRATNMGRNKITEAVGGLEK